MSSPEANLEELRQRISAFHAARAKTGEYLMGLRHSPLTQEQKADVVRRARDPAMEARAVQELKVLHGLLLGREPTSQEMEEGLGVLPVIPIAVAAAVGGGAWSLSSIFGYLEERERTAQRELNPTAARWADVVQQSLPLVAVGGGILGVWYLWGKYGGK